MQIKGLHRRCTNVTMSVKSVKSMFKWNTDRSNVLYSIYNLFYSTQKYLFIFYTNKREIEQSY